MTVPSREEVARAVAKAWGWDDTHEHRAEAYVAKRLDAIARTTVNGEPLRIVIGTTHEGCETCSGSGMLPGRVRAKRDNTRSDCPDGRPVYWTVKGMNDEDS